MEFLDPVAAKLVQLIENPWLEALQDHAVGVLNLPVRPKVRYGCPIHADMVIIAEPEEFLAGELGAIIGDDGVWYSEAVDDVGEEEHRLL